MGIVATNRIKTKREIEVVFNLHRDDFGESVTMSIYASGMQTTVFLTRQEAYDLQNAIDRTALEIDEETN